MKPSDFTAQKIYISHSSVVSRTIPPKVHHITIEIYGFPSELRIDTHSANFLISRGYPRTNHPRDTGVQQRVRKREIDLSSGPVEYTLAKKKTKADLSRDEILKIFQTTLEGRGRRILSNSLFFTSLGGKQQTTGRLFFGVGGSEDASINSREERMGREAG